MSTVQTYVLGQKNAADLDAEQELPAELMTINMGPSHPAMHGTIRMVLQIDGERVVDADVQPGYLHRCFEKESEYATYTQIFPYTDRLNYVSPMLNNVGFALAVEKLLGIETPERCQYIRVIIGEMSRITDHLTCIGASAMEVGAFTAFLYLLKAREWFYELLEELSGARLTHSYVRIGGVARDLTADFDPKLRDLLNRTEGVLAEVETLLTNNRIFRQRMEGVSVVSRDDAIAWGFTGPLGRASGLDYDVRKDYPYLVYDRVEFDVPVGEHGDCFDRYLVRMEEMRQSIRILRQCLDQIRPGPICVDDLRVTLPDKSEVYNTIEAMIAHFKLIVDGIRVPPGQTYSFTEGGNGELGFFVIADGTGRPYKVHVRSPCFIALQALPSMIRGALISDIIPTFGMINMIGGECDR
ncbi:MAG: NADH-quinone oxidoreductase subunit D [Deltaproteobacteria bacterium]|nr:MAG: NADH-quinone oxidoreductase subunit D [Deltaproteobacteria bacterium]